MKDITPKEEPSFIRKAINETKNHVGSFIAGAVPSAVVTTVIGGVYSLGAGLAGLVGLGGVAKATVGVIGVVAAAVPVFWASFLGGGAALLGIAAVLDKFGVKERGKAITAGVAAGALGALYALSATGGEEPVTTGELFQADSNGAEIVQLDDFRSAVSPDVYEVAVNDDEPQYYTTAPTQKLG
ncbi:MAG: hypothetical protein AAF244_00965 [Pseudomonadota bacterium]